VPLGPSGSGAPLDEEEVKISWDSVSIPTVRVWVTGDRTKPAVITFHEVGTNHSTCFRGFLSHPGSEKLRDKLCFYHIDAPGQSADDPVWADGVEYPSLDQLADQVGIVAKQLGLKVFFGMGVGAGANILLRYDMMRQSEDPVMRGLLAVSPLVRAAGWLDWGYEKVVRAKTAWSGGEMPSYVINQLIGQFFGPQTQENNLDLMQQWRRDLAQTIRPQNYLAFVQSYLRRTDLPTAWGEKGCKLPVLMFYGGRSIYHSSMLDALENFKSDHFAHVEIFADGDFVQEESPAKVAESFRLFCRGFHIMI